MKKYKLVILAFSVSYFSIVFAEDAETELSRSEKVKEFCEANPDHPKCEKFLDAKYRRFKDVEKIDDTEFDKKLKLDTELEGKARKRELLTFCRENPKSPRCLGLGVNPER